MEQNTIKGIVSMSIMGMFMVIMFIVAPLIGSEMDQAVILPGAGTGSTWNSSVNTDVPTAVGLWASLSGALKTLAFVVIIGFIIATLRGTKIK